MAKSLILRYFATLSYLIHCISLIIRFVAWLKIYSKDLVQSNYLILQFAFHYNFFYDNILFLHLTCVYNFNLIFFEKSVPIAADRNFLNDTLLNKNISIRWIFRDLMSFYFISVNQPAVIWIIFTQLAALIISCAITAAVKLKTLVYPLFISD